jgi:hemerythrin-like domain-containing protein
MPARAQPSDATRMREELIAVHTIMRRGADLVVAALNRLASGSPTDVGAQIATARWLVEFVHHHHASEDDLFWPVLREVFPEQAAVLDALTEEHQELDDALGALSQALDDLAAAQALTGEDRPAAAVGLAVIKALPPAEKIRSSLAAHLDAEEPVLEEMFPKVSPEELRRLRAAVIDGAPRSGPDLVLGLLEYPDRADGYAAMTADLPAPIRLLRPLLLARFRARTRKLGTRQAGDTTIRS